MIDSVLALNAEIRKTLSRYLPEELSRRVARSGNLTAYFLQSLLRNVCSLSCDAVIRLHQEFFEPFRRWNNMCFPSVNRAVNSRWCFEDKSCSLVYRPGTLLALFFVDTWPDCKELVIQNGLNIHYVSSTLLFWIQLMLVDLDPNQVSTQVVQQFRMICMKLSISSDKDAKDDMEVHKLDSTQTQLFRPEVYGNHERLGL